MGHHALGEVVLRYQTRIYKATKDKKKEKVRHDVALLRFGRKAIVPKEQLAKKILKSKSKQLLSVSRKH